MDVWLVRVEMECCSAFVCGDFGFCGMRSGNSSDDVSMTMAVGLDLGLLMRGPRLQSTADVGLRPPSNTSR